MTKPTFICCKGFLLLFKEETVLLRWAVLVSLLTESLILFNIILLLTVYLSAYFYFVTY